MDTSSEEILFQVTISGNNAKQNKWIIVQIKDSNGRWLEIEV